MTDKTIREILEKLIEYFLEGGGELEHPYNLSEPSQLRINQALTELSNLELTREEIIKILDDALLENTEFFLHFGKEEADYILNGLGNALLKAMEEKRKKESL